jgi:hypothetical protein
MCQLGFLVTAIAASTAAARISTATPEIVRKKIVDTKFPMTIIAAR